MRDQGYRSWPGCRWTAVCAAVASGLGLAMPWAADAATWEYGVNLEVGVIRTDNVFLADDGLEDGDTVFTASPEFFLTTDGDRLVAELRYRPEAFFYSEFNGADDVFHVLDADLTSQLLKDRFFVNLGAVNYQSIVTPDVSIPTSNLPISENRVDANTVFVRPYWQQRIGQIDLFLETRYSTAKFDDKTFQTSDELAGQFNLSNIQRQQGLAWGIDYQHRRTEYEISEPWEYQRAALDIGFWLNTGLRVFAVGGAETSFDNFFSSDLDAEFWEAGFQYKPNQRLNFELAAGDRSYGTSFRGDFSYQLRRGSIAVTYAEAPQSRSDLIFDRRPIADPNGLDFVFDRPGSSDRFIQSRGEISASIKLSKSDLGLSVYEEHREFRSTANGIPLPNEDVTGANLLWSWRFGAKTLLDFGADFAERAQTGRNDTIYGGRIGFGYHFSQRTSIRLEAQHSQQEGEEANDFNYTINLIRFVVRMELGERRR